MAELTTKLARAFINSTRGTAFDGVGCDFGPQDGQLDATDPAIRFKQAHIEREDAPRFLSMFPEFPLDGLEILDFGCGYGGKAIEFARTANRVVGVEPVVRHIEFAKRYAESRGVGNVEFKLCGQEDIPCANDAFDMVVSHDVIEHVKDPRISLNEIYRVLKPGGHALIVFPPYWGALSHHLDYVTRYPGIHWLFAPETLVAAVNSLGRDNVPQQPSPQLGWAGKRKVLPMLNGLSGREFREIAGLFDIKRIDPVLIGSGGHRGLAKVAHSVISRPMALLGGLARDMVTASILAVLRKPPA